MWGTINKKTKQLVGINFQSNSSNHFKAELKLCPCCKGSIYVPKKVKDLFYGTYFLAGFRKKFSKIDWRLCEYYMICPDCGSNNLSQSNWLRFKLFDLDLVIKCNDCKAKYEESEMYIIAMESEK